MTQAMTVSLASNLKSVTADHDAGTVTAAQSVPAQGRARIMVVDDDRLLRHSVSRLISTEPGLTVIGEAENGQDAVTLARTLRPDVVVMDVRMPLMDGVEATFLITEEWPETLVVGFSSSYEHNIKAKMLKAGAVDVLAKGEDAARLAPTIHRLWAERCRSAWATG